MDGSLLAGHLGPWQSCLRRGSTGSWGTPETDSPGQPSAIALSRRHVHCYTNKTRHQQTKERASINNLRLKTWKQPKSPLTRMDKDVVHIHNGIHCVRTDSGTHWVRIDTGTHWVHTDTGTHWVHTDTGTHWVHTDTGTHWVRTDTGTHCVCIDSGTHCVHTHTVGHPVYTHTMEYCSAIK